MKVAVKVVLEVDLDAWRREYGSDDTALDVYETLKNDATYAVAAAFSHLEDVVVVHDAWEVA